MTYCLALRLEDSLVFLSDTRTNAGIDNIGTYRKLHVLRPAPDRVFVLESAGNLATTQEVLDRIEHVGEPSSSLGRRQVLHRANQIIRFRGLSSQGSAFPSSQAVYKQPGRL